jgi:beta-glucanase (GH16 family)
MIWTPNLIKLLVDDTLLVQLGIGTNAPFDNPHYLLLNIAMGGTLGGTIPNSFSEDSMEIDYVRFYQ